MPPKSATTAAEPPRRSSRPCTVKKTRQNLTTTPEPSQEVVPAISPLITQQIKTPPPPTPSNSNLVLVSPLSHTHPKNSENDTVTHSRTTLGRSGHDETILVEREAMVVSSTANEAAKDGLSSAPSIQPAGGNGKRKIVKKTVRVVKKVIKKRVPKRILTTNSSQNQQELDQKLEKGLSSCELREVVDIAECVTEKKANLVDEVIERTTPVNGMKEVSKVEGEVVESSNLANSVDERCNEIGVTVTEKRTSTNEVTEKSKEEISNLMNGVTAKSDIVDEVMERSNNADEVTERLVLDGGVCFPEPNAVAPVCTAPPSVTDSDSMETKASKIDSSQCVGEKDYDPSCSSEMETTTINFGIEVQGQMVCEKGNDQNVGPRDSVVLAGERSSSPIVKSGSNSGEGKGDSVEMHEGLLLSGELEALERKKRRKTQIFVGGLDKDAKEKDIRKVFEEAGTVVDLSLKMHSKTGKNKGFAFVRFATAADAKNALEKCSKTEICGKQCTISPVEGNDTIFLRHIDRKWKTEDVVQYLEKAGIEKIDVVTLKADPNDFEKNRGFAFVEFETIKDAQRAFTKLQKKHIPRNNSKIRVSWAESLVEPAEEEILKVKSVYAEFLPSSWDEEKIKEYFKRFGEIENVVLAKNLPSSRRKDFAFVNYTTRSAALVCIEAISRERLEDDDTEVKMAVSLAKPFPRSKQIKHASDPTSKQFSVEKPTTLQATRKLHEPKNQERPSSNSYDLAMIDASSSTTNELVQILRQQASSGYIPPRQSIGTFNPDLHFPPHGNKRPFPLVGANPPYLESRGLPRPRIESPYPISGPSALSHGAAAESYPYHQQLLGPVFSSGHQYQSPVFGSASVERRNIHPSHFKTREQAPHYGNNGLHRRH